MVRVKVKSAVEAKGWNVKDLSYHANIGMSTAYRLMEDAEYDESDLEAKGGPTIVVLQRVAKALGVNITDLIEGDKRAAVTSQPAQHNVAAAGL